MLFFAFFSDTTAKNAWLFTKSILTCYNTKKVRITFFYTKWFACTMPAFTVMPQIGFLTCKREICFSTNITFFSERKYKFCPWERASLWWTNREVCTRLYNGSGVESLSSETIPSNFFKVFLDALHSFATLVQSAKIGLSKWNLYVKNHLNLSDFLFIEGYISVQVHILC